MKITPKIRKELSLLSLPVIFVACIALLNHDFVSVRSGLVGTWKSSDASSTVLSTFKPNGNFESVTTFTSTGASSYEDGSGVGIPLVFKGNYSVSGDTFRTFNLTRYIRTNGTDVLFVPCTGSLSCVSGWDIVNGDKEVSDPKYFSTIVSANWKRGVIEVRSFDYGQYKGSVCIMKRQ